MAAKKPRNARTRVSVNVRPSANCEKDIKAIKAIAAALGFRAPRVSSKPFGTVLTISSRAKFLYLDNTTLESSDGMVATVTGWVKFYPNSRGGGGQVSVYEDDMAQVVATLLETYGRDADDIVMPPVFAADI